MTISKMIGHENRALNISFIPTGLITATNVQRAIEQILAVGYLSGALGATDNAVLRANGTGGATAQGSGVIIDDADALSGVSNVTGADTDFVTGTAGTSGNIAMWNGDGDLVDGSIAAADLVITSDLSDYALLTSLNDYALLADLASTANGDGASLIGVEDSGGNFTATNLEGVLAELAAGGGGGDAWSDPVDADIVPDGDGTRDLGSAAAGFDDLFLASGSVINWANGDVTITHATNTLTFAGASTGNGYQFDATVRPDSDDGAALGSTAAGWSDLFLASGAVVNFNNGDVTLTHSSNLLTLAGGGLNLGDNLFQRPYLQDYAEVVNALGDLGGGTDDIDLTAGNVVSATVSTSTQTFTFSNPPASGRAGKLTLYLTNGGSQTVNWPASVDWVGGTPPTLTAAGLDILVFTTIDGGTTWFGNLVGADYS